jgi:hypothetical protein
VVVAPQHQQQQQQGDVTTSRIGDGTVLARPH